MERLRKVFTSILLVLFVFGTMAITSCTSHPNEEQIKALEEAKAAALAAEKTQAEKVKERQDLERQVKTKEAELAKVKADKEKVKQFLENNN
jgi:septal ring factor EnvC (AmiA/AmiB activator)